MISPRQNFIKALELGTPSGLVPHFELVFYGSLVVCVVTPICGGSSTIGKKDWRL